MKTIIKGYSVGILFFLFFILSLYFLAENNKNSQMFYPVSYALFLVSSSIAWLNFSREGNLPKELKNFFWKFSMIFVVGISIVSLLLNKLTNFSDRSLYFEINVVLSICYSFFFYDRLEKMNKILKKIDKEAEEKELEDKKQKEWEDSIKIRRFALHYLHELLMSNKEYIDIEDELTPDEKKAFKILKSRRYASPIKLCNKKYLLAMSPENFEKLESKINPLDLMGGFTLSEEDVENYSQILFKPKN